MKKRTCTLTKDDYDHFAKLINNGECWSCHCQFSWTNKPTLDRINNEFGHSKTNVRLACSYCNAYCSNLDAEMQQFYIQLKRFSEINCLTNSISDPTIIKKLFDAMANGDFDTAYIALNNIIEFRDFFLQRDLWAAFSTSMNLLGYEGNFAPDYVSPIKEEYIDEIRNELIRMGEL